MLQLLKSELKYNWMLYASAALIILGNLMILVFLGGKELLKVERFNKFYNIFLGVVPVLIIGKILVMRFKEKREMFIAIVPVDVKQISRSKSLSFLVPFVILVLFYILLNQFDFGMWKEIFPVVIDSVFFTFFYLCLAIIVYEIWYAKFITSNKKYIGIIFLITLFWLIISYIVKSISGDNLFFNSLLLFLFGVGQLVVSEKIYNRSKSYLKNN